MSLTTLHLCILGMTPHPSTTWECKDRPDANIVFRCFHIDNYLTWQTLDSSFGWVYHNSEKEPLEYSKEYLFV